MNADELYQLYSAWTGQLHFYARRELGRQLNAEFYPAPEWKITLSAAMEESTSAHGIPRLSHIGGETFGLPRPEDNPTKDQLDEVFLQLCWGAARVLEIDLGKPKLQPPCEKSTKKSPRLRTRKRSSGTSSSR